MTEEREIEVAGSTLARMLFGWETPMWRYRNPFSEWYQGYPPSEDERKEDDA